MEILHKKTLWRYRRNYYKTTGYTLKQPAKASRAYLVLHSLRNGVYFKFKLFHDDNEKNTIEVKGKIDQSDNFI